MNVSKSVFILGGIQILPFCNNSRKNIAKLLLLKDYFRNIKFLLTIKDRTLCKKKRFYRNYVTNRKNNK
jgi:hypothetical protein